MTAFRDSPWESLFETTNEAERLLEETKTETNVNDVLVSQKYTNAYRHLCALHEPLAPMGAYAYS
jgi:hypothetical protein